MWGMKNVTVDPRGASRRTLCGGWASGRAQRGSRRRPDVEIYVVHDSHGKRRTRPPRRVETDVMRRRHCPPPPPPAAVDVRPAPAATYVARAEVAQRRLRRRDGAPALGARGLLGLDRAAGGEP